jgi:hypothetical protein
MLLLMLLLTLLLTLSKSSNAPLKKRQFLTDEWYLKHEKLIFYAGFTVILIAVFMLVAW